MPQEPSEKPQKHARQERGVDDKRVTMTAGVPASLPGFFKELARERTEKNREGMKGKKRGKTLVTQRELHEEAVKELLAKLRQNKRWDVRGSYGAGPRKAFWLSADLYEEMRDAANERNIPVTYLFVTACLQYLEGKGIKITAEE